MRELIATFTDMTVEVFLVPDGWVGTVSESIMARCDSGSEPYLRSLEVAESDLSASAVRQYKRSEYLFMTDEFAQEIVDEVESERRAEGEQFKYESELEKEFSTEPNPVGVDELAQEIADEAEQEGFERAEGPKEVLFTEAEKRKLPGGEEHKAKYRKK